LLTLYKAGNEGEFLRSFHFEVGLRPRYCELDALGHVSNTVYPAYLEFGRLQYFIAARDPETGPFAFAHVTAELHLRYVAACFYDEPLRVLSKLTHLGRASATMEQALVAAEDAIRAVSRVAIVRSNGERTGAWSDAQRAALEALERRPLTAR
jgi:acyl-CoA thioester hydrolase